MDLPLPLQKLPTRGAMHQPGPSPARRAACGDAAPDSTMKTNVVTNSSLPASASRALSRATKSFHWPLFKQAFLVLRKKAKASPRAPPDCRLWRLRKWVRAPLLAEKAGCCFRGGRIRRKCNTSCSDEGKGWGDATCTETIDHTSFQRVGHLPLWLSDSFE